MGNHNIHTKSNYYLFLFLVNFLLLDLGEMVSLAFFLGFMGVEESDEREEWLLIEDGGGRFNFSALAVTTGGRGGKDWLLALIVSLLALS